LPPSVTPGPYVRTVDIPTDLALEIGQFAALSRWERAELGRALRRLGLSYGEIRELIPVPKGTLVDWCREIHLSEEQVALIKQRRGPREGPRDTQWKRRAEVEAIRAEARRFARDHLEDPVWTAGTVLYWGEGSKTTRRLELSNADPRALRFFMGWTARYLDTAPQFVAALNLHANNDARRARRWWERELGLAESEFTKTYIKPDGTGHRKNHLPNGVCRVRLRRGTDAFLRTMVWVDVVADAWAAPLSTDGLTSPPGR